MADLPTGTVTFLFTDIEGSTSLLERHGDRYADLLADYRRLVRAVVQEHHGQEIDTQGDAFFVAFPRARDGVAAAVVAQRAIVAHPWPDGAVVRVRMGLHTGEPIRTDAGYVGMDVHRAARICAAGHGGQILLSQTTRDLLEPDLTEGMSLRDLGTHRLKDLTRPQRLFQVVAADLPVDFPPPRSLDVLPNNLPLQLSSFIGRTRELAEVKRLLFTTRLLTLTGAGGSGKTRLALQAAANVLGRFPDGVWLVDLSSLSNPALVPQMVATTLRVPEEPRRPLTDTLADELHHRSMLLILDNCEHLLTGCAHLANGLLGRSPDLRILATSREALGIAGETVWPVPTLALPDPQLPASLEELAQSEAVRLFVERAAAVQPAFDLTMANAPVVADICRNLDGIPLAIELAAARTKVLTAEQIAARLGDRFQLLTGGSRTAPPRHQTLRTALDWSHDLLSPQEQTLLQRLAIFAGGFTLEAAEQICDGHGIAEAEVLDLLTHLVDKSLALVERVTGAEARYRLLETVRQHAAEKLAASGELPLVRARHGDWFVAYAERAEWELRANQAVWVERLATELDNMRAAMEWSLTPEGNPELSLRIAGALGLFWDVRGFYREGRRWIEEMLAKARGATGGVRAKALAWASVLAWRQGDYEQVKAFGQEARALSEAYGERWSLGLALHQLGHTAHVDGDLSQAEQLLQNSVDVFRAVGDTWGLAYSLNCLGDLARTQGAADQARARLEEAVALWRRLNNNWGLALSLNNLGHVTQHQGDSQRAWALFTESLTNFRAVGAKHGMMYCLTGLAAAAAREGRLRRAARLFGASEALLKAAGVTLEPVDRTDYERNLEKVRAGLHEQIFGEAWQVGQMMSLNEAVAYALSTEEPAPMAAGRASAKVPLTPREQEVAALIARGLTNREIAAVLVITERTAETHVQNILNKLGFDSRAQIAAWAVEHELLSPSPD